MRLRVFAIACVLAALGLAYVLLGTPQNAVSATNGRAVPMGDSGMMFTVTLDLQNDGAPLALTNVSSPTGAHASFMNPGHDGVLVIPGGDTAQLAMDGAHIMLHVHDQSFSEGTYHSLALTFDDGSELTARILYPEPTGEMGAMDHGAANGVETTPSPAIALARDPEVDAGGFDVEISVENFEFVLIEDSAPHVDGQGHAHIYLNGVKLGRLYETQFEIGALVPGDYVLTVALNSNDHRPYVSDGAPIMVTFEFSL